MIPGLRQIVASLYVQQFPKVRLGLILCAPVLAAGDGRGRSRRRPAHRHSAGDVALLACSPRPLRLLDRCGLLPGVNYVGG
jgi:hypothetical protein